jgi:polyisoprenoid-binding protein YceI
MSVNTETTSTQAQSTETGSSLTGTYDIDAAHSRLGFAAKHAMVATVRGSFRVYTGEVYLDEERPENSWAKVEIDATSVETGNTDRDAHLRTPDFFDVENHPTITFRGRFTERSGATTFKGDVALTIRGGTRTVPLDVHYLGEWKTPFWVGEANKGELRRIGLEATARINRHDFGVSWQDEIPGGGVVVSNEIELIIDVEAILLEDLERTGAVEYYRN